jgi:RimJ/RimL family protein N-acetyltransferase
MAFDLQPTLIGDLIALRPLKPEHWDDLFAVASDPLIWKQHPASDRYKEPVFKAFFREAQECGGAFVVLDKKTQQIIGSTRFYGHNLEKSEIEIGWTFLARRYWGGRHNGDMKRLLLSHAFQFVDTVAFYVGQNNIRSQKAMERIGGIKEGMVEKTYQGVSALNVRYVIRKPR